MIAKSEYPMHSEYKASGYDWIGEVPAHWSVEKLGNCLSAVSLKGRPDLPLLSITRESGVIERDVDDQESNHNFIPEDLSNYKVLRAGQFGMNKMKAWQGSYGISAHTGIVSPAYFVFDVVHEVDPEFFNQALRSKLYVSYFAAASDGVRIGQWDLSKTRMRDIPVVLPPIREQRVIANYLREKCANIDEAVRIKEEQIDLLRERLQALVQEVATRGLNPDAPLKESGIDGIGQIPTHWKVRRNFVLFREVKVSGRADLPVLSVSIHDGVSAEELSDEANIRSINKIEDRTAYKEVLCGDIAYNMMRAWQGGIGAVSVHGMVSPAYVVARPTSDLIANYFELLYRCPAFIHQMDRASKGITDFRKRLYWDDFKNLLTVVPPRDEQARIVEHLGDLSATTEAAISLKKEQVTRLKDYRTCLINAAVTGKIKVS